MAKIVLDNGKEIQLSEETTKNLVKGLQIEETFGRGSIFEQDTGAHWMLFFDFKSKMFNLVCVNHSKSIGKTYTHDNLLLSSSINPSVDHRFTLSEIQKIGGGCIGELKVIERR